MSQHKVYSSLKKRRPGGVMPQNRLMPAQKINIPTEHTVNRGKLYVVKPQSLDNKEHSPDIKSCFFLSTSIRENGLEEEPAYAAEVEMVEYNGTEIQSEGSATLHLCVSENKEYMFFKRSNALIDKMVLPKKCIQTIYFAENYTGALIVLSKNFGYMAMAFSSKGKSIYKFLQNNRESWVLDPIKVVSPAEIGQFHREEIRRHENSQKDPFTVVRPDDLSGSGSDDSEPLNLGNGSIISDDIFRNGLPSLPKMIKRRPLERQTRSVSRQMIDPDSSHNFLGEKDTSASGDEGDTTFDEPPQFIRETPAPFEPPLRHSLDENKKFIITYNDFKTLYNNDWINDTLIDFFIAYDMHKAVTELHSIKKSDVFAFNSFFFLKLFTKTEQQQVAPYYKNIRRWLNKVDLMSFSSVIIPINEHLHWYFVIIKNLPALLEYSKMAKKTPTENTEVSEVSDVSEVQPIPKPAVDIWVIDSLKQNHPNLGPPLREVIKEYCKEKHGVDIPTEVIRLKNASVSKQKNFNDCGIHVIYNISKWLENPHASEQIWGNRGRGKSSVFKPSERDGMRRRCIDILLELHSNQPPETPSPANKDTENVNSDDEVELISISSSYPQHHEENKQSGDLLTNDIYHVEPENSRKKEHDNSLNEIGALEKPKDEPTNSEQLQIANSVIVSSSPKVLASPENPEDFTEKKPIAFEEEERNETRPSSDVGTTEREPGRESKPSEVPEEKTSHEIPKKVDTLMSKYHFPTSFKQKVLLAPTQTIENTTPRKTLDPRVINGADPQPIGLSKRIDTLKKVLHPQIRRLLLGLKLNKETVEFLNSVFNNHSQRFGEGKLGRMKELIEEYRIIIKKPDTLRIQTIESILKEMSQKPTVPMDEPFIIKDPEENSTVTESELQDIDDSNGDLNKSVGELSLSRNKSLSHSTRESTPEATRQFLRRTEASSPTPRDPIYRHTRSMERRQSEDINSDLEIVDDDLELVSEVSLVFSSPRDKTETSKAGSPKERRHKSRKPEKLTGFFSSPTTRSDVVDIQEIHENAQKPRNAVSSEKTRKIKASKDSKIPSIAPKIPGTLRSSIFSQAPRSSKSAETPDLLEVAEVVNVPEEEEPRRSPTRKFLDSSSKSLKRRRLESSERAQEIRRQLHKK